MADEDRIDINCSKCDETAVHHPDCIDKDFLPLICDVNEDGFIRTVTTHSGNVMKGIRCLQPYTFQCPDLPAFTVGRALLQTNEGFHWHLFTERFEEKLKSSAHRSPTPLSNRTSPGSRFAPQANSTSIQSRASPRRDTERMPSRINLSQHHNSSIEIQDLTEALAQSQRKSNLSLKLMEFIPKFYGKDKRNFDPWKQKVQLARKSCPDEEVMHFVMMSIQGEASTFVGTIGNKAAKLDTLLAAMTYKYDDLGTDVQAQVALTNLSQENQTLTAHHGEVTRVLRALGEEMSTRSKNVLTAYVQSLSTESVRIKLFTRLESDDRVTLQDLMDTADRFARIKEMDRTTRSKVSTRSVAAARIDEEVVAAVRQDQGNRFAQKRPRIEANRQSSSVEQEKWCEIHESVTHDTARCRASMWKYCPWCQTRIEPTPMADHIKVCKAPRCHKCGRKGHKQNECRTETPGQGQGQGHSHGYNQNRNSRPVPRGNRTHTSNDNRSFTAPAPVVRHEPPPQAAQLTQLVAAAMQTDAEPSETPGMAVQTDESM